MDGHTLGALLFAAAVCGVIGRYQGAGWYALGMLGLTLAVTGFA